jgi:hypothetical protein
MTLFAEQRYVVRGGVLFLKNKNCLVDAVARWMKASRKYT